MLSLKTHNILDYVFGVVFILCPAIFGFSDVDAARNVFVVLGAGLIGYSLLTDYRYSIAKLIPLGAHMMLDLILGFAFMLAPTVLGYRPLLTDGQFALHFVAGLGSIGLVVFTRPRGRMIRGVTEEIRREEKKAA